MHSHMARRAYRWLTAFAAVFVAISTIVALPQSARAAERLNHKYSVPDTNYPVPQSNGLWVSPEGDEDSEADDEVETVKATSMMPSDIWIDILTLIAPST